MRHYEKWSVKRWFNVNTRCGRHWESTPKITKKRPARAEGERVMSI